MWPRNCGTFCIVVDEADFIEIMADHDELDRNFDEFVEEHMTIVAQFTLRIDIYSV